MRVYDPRESKENKRFHGRGDPSTWTENYRKLVEQSALVESMLACVPPSEYRCKMTPEEAIFRKKYKNTNKDIPGLCVK